MIVYESSGILLGLLWRRCLGYRGRNFPQCIHIYTCTDTCKCEINVRVYVLVLVHAHTHANSRSKMTRVHSVCQRWWFATYLAFSLVLFALPPHSYQLYTLLMLVFVLISIWAHKSLNHSSAVPGLLFLRFCPLFPRSILA